MIEFLIALLICGITAIVAWLVGVTISYYRDRVVAKRLWEEHMRERGGKQ